MADRPLVSITHLSKSYRRGEQIVPVLRDITLAIPEGDFIALMGPSGSGKSTLLNLIAGIDKPDSGELLVGGEDITRLSESELADWRAANVGFIFQFYNLMPVLSAFGNVELPLLLTSLSRRERHERVATALALVSLSDRAEHYPNELSGGQQQRVAIARAIISDPTLIVVVAIASFGILRTIVDAWYAGANASSSARLVTRSSVSLVFPLPLTYAQKIRQVDGVESVAAVNWFGGVYISERNFFPQFAIQAP